MKKDNLFRLKKGAYIVTGGLGLLGKMHCEAIAEFGGIPVIFDINSDGFEEFKINLKAKTSIEPLFLETNITNEASIIKSLHYLEKSKIKIKGLINNAARNPIVNKDKLTFSNRLEDFNLDEWNKDIQIGLTGAFLCSKHVGNIMHKDSGGTIINVSSDLGLIAPNQNLYKDNSLRASQQPVKPITYSVIKSGLIGLTKYLSTYWPTTIRSNCICPGGVYTNQSDDFLNRVKNLIPMNRMANKNEYKGIVIYLLSEASSYMTGSIISIDGGRTAW